MVTGKYDSKSQEPFSDPVLRCDSCQHVFLREIIHELGCCPECGNRRVRNVLILKPEEMERLKKEGIDPEFLALFEAMETDGT